MMHYHNPELVRNVNGTNGAFSSSQPRSTSVTRTNPLLCSERQSREAARHRVTNFTVQKAIQKEEKSNPFEEHLKQVNRRLDILQASVQEVKKPQKCSDLEEHFKQVYRRLDAMEATLQKSEVTASKAAAGIARVIHMVESLVMQEEESRLREQEAERIKQANNQSCSQCEAWSALEEPIFVEEGTQPTQFSSLASTLFFEREDEETTTVNRYNGIYY